MPYISSMLSVNSTAINPVPPGQVKALRSLRIGERVDDLTLQPGIERIRLVTFLQQWVRSYCNRMLAKMISLYFIEHNMHLIRYIAWKRFHTIFTFLNLAKIFLSLVLSITGTITASNLVTLLMRGNDHRKEALDKYMLFATPLPETNMPMPLLSRSRGSAQ